MKAQRGRLPRPPSGNELTARLSQEGVLTRTVRDTAPALDLLQAMPRGGSFMPVAPIATADAVDGDPGRLDRRLDRLLRPPAIVIPAGRGPDGMPIGVQLGGGFGSELRLPQVARQLDITAS